LPTAFLDDLGTGHVQHTQYPVRDEDAARLHPYWYKHVNVTGHYSFHAQELGAAARRPLRDPDLPGDE
jgi:hypothetical protein